VHHEQIQEWIAEPCESGMSEAAVHSVVGVISGALEVAVRAKRLPANPAARVELPHSTSRRKRYPTADQVALMAEAARALPPTRARPTPNASLDQHRPVVYVPACCGLRWSEVAALRTHSLDLVKGWITVAAAVVEVDRIGLGWCGCPKESRGTMSAHPEVPSERSPLTHGDVNHR
jgi:site-specific recombinase XerC